MSLKFCYTNADGTVSIVHAAPKEHLERVLGPLTDEEYKSHVIERSIPKDAINVREVSDEHIPTDRKYRDAWVDVTDLKTIDLDLKKVKDMLLKQVRQDRDDKLSESDSLVSRALESGEDISKLREQRQSLRDATNALKDIKVSEKDINSAEKLAELEAAVPTIEKVKL